MPSVGVGYKHLVQPLISCYCLPPDGKLLKALLNVLVDSDFDLANNPTIEVLFFGSTCESPWQA